MEAAHPRECCQVNSDILGPMELAFPFECVLSVYVIPRHVLGPTLFSGSPKVFRGPEETDPRNIGGKYP